MSGKRQRRDFEKALRGVSKRVREAFFRAIDRARTGARVGEITALLDQGDIEGAVQALRLTDADLSALLDAVRGGMIEGGALAEAIAPKGLRGRFSFDGFSPRADEWLRFHGGRLIQGIQEDTLEATRSVIRGGISQGASSRRIALDLVGRKVGAKRVGGHLGLTAQITDSITAGREKLASGDPALMREYLGLKLRDRRFDARVRRAIREGRALQGADLDALIEAHKSKALKYRGAVIGKHEARKALAFGRHESFEQMLEREDVEAVTKRWQHNMSREPRQDHVKMDGTKVDFRERFSFEDGTQMSHPHEDGAPAAHTIGCGCMAIYRVKLRHG